MVYAEAPEIAFVKAVIYGLFDDFWYFKYHLFQTLYTGNWFAKLSQNRMFYSCKIFTYNRVALLDRI